MISDKITGLMIYYYFVCKKKLWFYINGITMEDENENVQIGKFIDENAYKGDRKHILINGEINIDFVRNTGVIHEIKKSRKIEDASIWQTKYYLFYLKKYGLSGIKAKIDYPLLKQTVDVELTEEDETEIKRVLDNIANISNSDIVPINEKNNICKKCAFHDLCKL